MLRLSAATCLFVELLRFELTSCDCQAIGFAALSAETMCGQHG